jgi:hypothetical protein
MLVGIYGSVCAVTAVTERQTQAISNIETRVAAVIRNNSTESNPTAASTGGGGGGDNGTMPRVDFIASPQP